MVACRVCGEELGAITHTHLAEHDMTLFEYQREYPDAPLIDPCVVRKSGRTSPDDSEGDED